MQGLEHFRRWRLADIAALENGAEVFIRLRIVQRWQGDAFNRTIRVEPGANLQQLWRPVLLARMLAKIGAESIGDGLIRPDPILEAVFDQLRELHPVRRRL